MVLWGKKAQVWAVAWALACLPLTAQGWNVPRLEGSSWSNLTDHWFDLLTTPTDGSSLPSDNNPRYQTAIQSRQVQRAETREQFGVGLTGRTIFVSGVVTTPSLMYFSVYRDLQVHFHLNVWLVTDGTRNSWNSLDDSSRPSSVMHLSWVQSVRHGSRIIVSVRCSVFRHIK